MTYVSIVFLILFLLNYLPSVLTNDVVIREKQVELFTTANIMASTMMARQQEFETQNKQPKAESAKGDRIEFSSDFAKEAYALLRIDSSKRVMVCDYAAKVVFDSAYRNNIEDKYLLLNTVYTALAGKSSFEQSIDSSAYEFSVTVPVTYMGKVLGAVYIYEYSTEQAELLESTNRYVFLLSIFIFVLAVSLSFLFTNLLTQQIKAINTAVRNMKNGIYDKKAKILSRDELGQLANQFNQLSDRLWETEEERRQFISNASHELKTPLAAIKLLSDSILENDMDQALVTEFLTDINGEIDRLTRITEQLLKLSKVDAEAEVKREQVDLGEIVGKVTKVLLQMMEQRGISLEQHRDRDCIVWGDTDRIYQIVMNLVENAVKYNREQGRVTVKLTAKGNKILLIVEDTGIGIDKENLDKIFDRFYRVDKARSRQTGGTGLGLSIVKSNAESMGAKVRVFSKSGRGTAFVVEFVRVSSAEMGGYHVEA